MKGNVTEKGDIKLFFFTVRTIKRSVYQFKKDILPRFTLVRCNPHSMNRDHRVCDLITNSIYRSST